MNKIKYIVVENYTESVIMFPETLKHKDVAGNMKVVSAGFCYLPDNLNPKAATFGKSVSLGIASREEDSLLIDRLFEE